MDRNNNFGVTNTRREKERLILRGKIVALKDAGLSFRQISAELGCCLKTVQRWLKREVEERDLNSRRRSGRSRATTADEDARIIARARATPLTTAVKITRDEGLVNRVSVRTVRNRLKEAALFHHVPACRETLTRRHVEERLNFCREHRNHTYDNFWQYVIFVDEKTFKSDQKGRMHVWRPAKTRYDERHIVETNHSGYVSLNMFGWIWSGGPGELTRITSRFTAQEYVSVLDTNVKQAVRTIALPENEHRVVSIVQDNCRVHTANIVKQWFRENVDFQPLRWPARSPDLNPIENVWGWIVNDWDHANERSPEALEQHVSRMWDRLRRHPFFFIDLAKSIPRRIQECLEAEGGHTKY